MGRLDDRVALITGANSGNGQATAVAFAEEGADVVVNYREDEAGARSTAAQVEAAGGRALVVQGDVGDEAAVRAMFELAVATLGRADTLMNNAGVDAAGTFVADVELAVTSVHEEIARAGAADYDCAKGALRNLTRTLKLEVAEDGINVNNIAPRMVLTSSNQEAFDDPEARTEQLASIPMKRAAEPREIGRLAVFLASSDGDYVTGSSYVMDGGLMQNQGQGA